MGTQILTYCDFSTERIYIKNYYNILYYINKNTKISLSLNSTSSYDQFNLKTIKINGLTYYGAKIINPYYKNHQLINFKNEIEIYNNKLLELPIIISSNKQINKTDIYTPLINTQYDQYSIDIFWNEYIWIYGLVFKLYFD